MKNDIIKQLARASAMKQANKKASDKIAQKKDEFGSNIDVQLEKLRTIGVEGGTDQEQVAYMQLIKQKNVLKA